MKSPTSRVEIVSDRHEENLLEDNVQLNDNAFQDGRGRNSNSPENIHRLEKDFSDEEKTLQNAPP